MVCVNASTPSFNINISNSSPHRPRSKTEEMPGAVGSHAAAKQNGKIDKKRGSARNHLKGKYLRMKLKAAEAQTENELLKREKEELMAENVRMLGELSTVKDENVHLKGIKVLREEQCELRKEQLVLMGDIQQILNDRVDLFQKRCSVLEEKVAILTDANAIARNIFFDLARNHENLIANFTSLRERYEQTLASLHVEESP